MNSSKTKTVKIPADILAEMDNMSGGTPYKIQWTEEMDAVLLAVWAKKRKSDVAALFTKHYGVKAEESLRKRYLELTSGK